MAKLEKLRIAACRGDQPFLNKGPGESEIVATPAPESRFPAEGLQERALR
jgi:hypothetical protein